MWPIWASLFALPGQGPSEACWQFLAYPAILCNCMGLSISSRFSKTGY